LINTSSCVTAGRAGAPDLLQHEVDIGDHLGDGCSLDAGVHLDEIEFAVLVEEFHGADAEIFISCMASTGRANFLARGASRPAKGLLPNLLMASLQRASRSPRWIAPPGRRRTDFDVRGFCRYFSE